MKLDKTIDKLVEEHGPEAVLAYFRSKYEVTAMGASSVPVQTDPGFGCSEGYYWDDKLKECVKKADPVG